MWTPLQDEKLGLMKEVSALIYRSCLANPGLLPDLSGAKTLVATSDFAGEHKSSRFLAIGLMLIDLQSWPRWEQARIRLRERAGIRTRRFGYAKLADRRKTAALRKFLAAADSLHGLVAVVLVDKAIRDLFESKPWDRPTYVEGISERTLERMLLVVHFLSVFLAGLSRQGQNVIWITDEDEIAANDARLLQLTNVMGNVCSHYLRHSLGHLRCGTTRSDTGILDIEDLVSIPDLAAGAMAELSSAYKNTGGFPSNGLTLPLPRALRWRARLVTDWLATRPAGLRRFVFAIERGEDYPALTMRVIKPVVVPIP
jgi:hypothetical protein